MKKDASLFQYTMSDKPMSAQYSTSEIPDGVADISARSMWDNGYKGEGVVVAVLDTGCTTTHPELKDRIIGGRNFTEENGSNINDFSDGAVHGSHVAGTIAAAQNGVGVVGVAPEVKLLIVKVLDNEGNGWNADIINGIDYAINWRGPKGEKVRVISMSLGSKFSVPNLQAAIKRADAAGICIVAASGNVGDGDETTDEISYPAYYPEVIAVGAYDGFGRVADFSNSNNQIDLIAPGVNIRSTDNGTGYVYSSGTSMAAPHVSGALALLANKLDKAYGRTATSTELYDYLINVNTFALEDVSKTSQGFGGLRFFKASELPAPPVPVRRKVKVTDVNINDVLEWFRTSDPVMLNTVDYWKNNAIAGKTCRGDYVQSAFKKIYIVQGLGAEVDE